MLYDSLSPSLSPSPGEGGMASVCISVKEAWPLCMLVEIKVWPICQLKEALWVWLPCVPLKEVWLLCVPEKEVWFLGVPEKEVWLLCVPVKEVLPLYQSMLLKEVWPHTL